MSYRYVVTATLVEVRRSRDDIASGYLRLETAPLRTIAGPGGLVPFTTRRTTVAACRRHYRAAAWRPENGDRVLIDGEFGEDDILIDALAPDLAPPFPKDGVPSLAAAALADQAAVVGAAHKHFRQDAAAPIRRLRAVKPYLETEGGTGIQAIAHLDIDQRDGNMRVWSVCADGKGLVTTNLTSALEDALAALAGLIDMPKPATPLDHLARHEGRSVRGVGNLEERSRRSPHRYRPGSALEAALRKAGLDHSALDEGEFDVPFETAPSQSSANAAVADDPCPF